MKKIIALTAMISATTFAAGAYAQDLGTDASLSSTPGVTVVDVNADPSTGSGSRAPATITDPTMDVIQNAQAEATSDPMIMASLEAQNVDPINVLNIETALNGGKIVYYR